MTNAPGDVVAFDAAGVITARQATEDAVMTDASGAVVSFDAAGVQSA